MARREFEHTPSAIELRGHWYPASCHVVSAREVQVSQIHERRASEGGRPTIDVGIGTDVTAKQNTMSLGGKQGLGGGRLTLECSRLLGGTTGRSPH